MRIGEGAVGGRAEPAQRRHGPPAGNEQVCFPESTPTLWLLRNPVCGVTSVEFRGIAALLRKKGVLDVVEDWISPAVAEVDRLVMLGRTVIAAVDSPSSGHAEVVERVARRNGGHWEEPDAGLSYVRARWLEPETGNWLSVDPVSGEPRYAYARQVLTGLVDPSGREAFGSPECLYPPGVGTALGHNRDTYRRSTTKRSPIAVRMPSTMLWPGLRSTTIRRNSSTLLTGVRPTCSITSPDESPASTAGRPAAGG